MFRPLSVFNRGGRNVETRPESFASDPFFKLQSEMNRLFDDAFSGFATPPAFRGEGEDARAPRIDMRETDGAVEVEAELPGVEEKDLDVQVRDNLLTVRGEKKFERKDEKEGDYRVTERSYGSFSRSISLPFSIDPDGVEATFRNGILKLTLPKPADARSKSRRIEIRRD